MRFYQRTTMLRTIVSSLLLVALVWLTSGCAAANLAASATPPSLTEPPSETVSPTSTPPPTKTPIQANTPVPTPRSTETPTPESGCPTLRGADGPSVLKTGSLLFAKRVATSELWAVSSVDNALKLILTDPGAGVYLSPSGEEVAWRDHGETGDNLAILDLGTGQRSTYVWESSWRALAGWSNDGRIKLLTFWERSSRVGETTQYIYLDPVNGTQDNVTERLDLPGYKFEENNPLGGYASLDPTGTLALYTARGSEGMDTVLRDVVNQRELWRYEATAPGTTFSPSANWTADGERVAFILAFEPTRNSRIFSLTRDGKTLEELTRQPLDSFPDYIVSYLYWSPDARHIHYSLFRNETGGPGFILDTLSSEVREICDEQASFAYGQWVTENLLAYVMLDESGRQQLRILDVDTWEGQVLVAGEMNEQFEIVGWTPLDVP